MMPAVSFTGLAIVAVVAFAIPLLLALAPRLRPPAVVLEILAGIVLGPAGLGVVRVDLPISILAVLGLAFLLFLAGLEIEIDRLRGDVLRVTGLGFALSLGLALACSAGLARLGLITAPLLVAIILSATALGIVIPLLKDAGQTASPFGQLVISSASLADFGAIILLSLFFSRATAGLGARLVLLGGFVLLLLALLSTIRWVQRWPGLGQLLVRLQDTTAQIRVRGAFALLALGALLAQRLGLEVILGAFMAGAILRLVDSDQMMTHPQFRAKLEGVGFGVFISIFFVASGLRFDFGALVASPATVAQVPLFLAALLVTRGVPALLYQRVIGGRRALVAGLLQATSLPFIMAATQIGLDLAVISPAPTRAAAVAGLFSVLLFPLAALTILGRAEPVGVESAAPAGGQQAHAGG